MKKSPRPWTPMRLAKALLQQGGVDYTDAWPAAYVYLRGRLPRLTENQAFAYMARVRHDRDLDGLLLVEVLEGYRQWLNEHTE